MLDNLNYLLFYLLNAVPDSPAWTISLAKFIAKYLISIVPILVLVLWMWGPKEQIIAQRYLITKTTLALSVSLTASCIFRHLFPYDRPFVKHIGYNFLQHAANNSFPSYHSTIIFTFALVFLFWHRSWSGIVLIAASLVIAWSRVYLGVHWPIDILGGFIAGMIGCLNVQILWNSFGKTLYSVLQEAYRICFSFPIRKGWIRH